MSDIIFTKDGRRYVVPHTYDFIVPEWELEETRALFPDAAIVPTVNDEDWDFSGYFEIEASGRSAYPMKEPRT